MLKGIIISALIVIMISMVAYALPTGFASNPNCGSNTNGNMHNNNNPRDNDRRHQPNPRDNHDNHGPNDNHGDQPGDNRQVIPEPSTLILLGIGALGMSAYRKIRK
jgi:septal ring-binding cell division protein DamX